MFYCPYCGLKTEEDESYCVSCGKDFPTDINERLKHNKRFNRFWYIPIFIAIGLFLTLGAYYTALENKSATAKELYNQGEKLILKENYNKARDVFEESLEYKGNFIQADVSLKFVKRAIIILDDLTEVTTLLNKSELQQAMILMNQAENSLKNFQGTAVTLLVNKIISKQERIKIAQLKRELSLNPDIYLLKTLLWEAEELKNDSAKEITDQIREQIVEYTFSKASEQLNNKQFNDAQTLIEDGLKYVPNSEKIQSLKTTIEKEKATFEAAQQKRIELALNLAAEEQELNKSDAIKLDQVKVEKDKQDRLVIKGEVRSVATIPVTSVLIEYSLFTKKGKELLSNKVFVYPDKLFPGETGKFEFTHYDTKDEENIKIKVNKIKWYTD